MNVVVGERELYQRFADYDDEELLRILTVERAQYRSEALAAAEIVLAQRGVATPTFFTAPEPPVVHVKNQARPKSPYLFIDLVFDLLLVCVVCWSLGKLWAWTMAPAEWEWSQFLFYILAPQVIGSAVTLRRKWRTKKWWD